MAKVGRKQSMTIDDLPKNWKETALDLMAEGFSAQYVCGRLGVTHKRHYMFLENEDYAEVFEIGKSLAWIWWEEKGRESLHDRNFNNANFGKLSRLVLKWDEEGEAEKKKPAVSEEIKAILESLVNRKRGENETVESLN